LAVTAPDLIGLFIEPLERTEIPYMITGGVASVIYGDPRFTRDIGVVMELGHPLVPRLSAVFQGEAFYVPPMEVLETEAGSSSFLPRGTRRASGRGRTQPHRRRMVRAAPGSDPR
jgi:hypothetical protein